MALLTPEIVYRRKNVMGVPDSGDHMPNKDEIIQLLNLLFGVSRGGWVAARTQAELFSTTPKEENDAGIVLNDPDPTKNGYYQRQDFAWVRERGFPDTAARLVSVAGSGSAITASTQVGVDPATVVMMFLTPRHRNPGPATLGVNGTTPRPLVAFDGEPLQADYLIAGATVPIYDNGTEYRLLFDHRWQVLAQRAEDAAEAAEQEANRAEAAADSVLPNTVMDGSITDAKVANPSSPEQGVSSSKISYLATAADAVARTLADKLQDSVSTRDFGAIGDGVADDTDALQAAIDYGFASHAPVFIAPGRYRITRTLILGDGSNASPSTLNGLWWQGSLAGTTAAEVLPSERTVVLEWDGAVGGRMADVKGPIVGLNIQGINFDCKGIAARAINFMHPINSRFEDITALGYTGTAFWQDAYATPTSCVIGSSGNLFTNLKAKFPASGGRGMFIGAFVAQPGHLDVARNIYQNCDWWRDGEDGTSYSLGLGFVDNCTFIECHTYAGGSKAGLGLYVLPPTGDKSFPKEVTFINSPIEGGVNGPSDWLADQGIGFFPYPLGDGQARPLPHKPGHFYGFTSDGRPFGASAEAILTFGSIAGQSSATQSVAVPGATAGDIVTLSVSSPWAAGFLLSGYVDGPNSVAVKWANFSSAAGAPMAGARTYLIDLKKR